MDYQGRYGLQKRQALRKWKSKSGRGPKGATYRQFIIVLCRARDKEMAEKVRELLTATSDTLDTFHKYLVDCYTITQHPSEIQWPFSRLSSYIDLTLVQAPDTQIPPSGQGESQAKPQPLREVQLGELFHLGSHQAKRNVVLVEGPAGCGKSTLSWHVCREWAAGRLFQQSFLLIHISLEDQDVLRAERLADIIPHESNEMKEAVAEAISEQVDKSVCFLFDAWDEAPRALLGRDSYLFKFITGISTKKLPHCSIIVMSRPVAAGLLYPHLTAHVNIRGFEVMKLENFICASLEDPNARQKLLQQLREKPQVKDLCTLPIHAAIVVHLFRSSHSTLPSTRTGIFKELVSSLLLRHMQLRTDHGLEQWEEEEFEHLPGNVLREFKSVCGLAFHGVMEDTKAFFLDSLRKLGVTHPSSPLGLMQAQQQLTGFRPRHCYSFLHYAVQEFLAAYHISKLSEEEQTKIVGQILHSTPLSTVLPFYAGLTGLSNEGACGILLKVTEHSLDYVTVTCALKHTLHESSDRRRLLLALLNCIYEAQNPSICKLVNPPVHPSSTGMTRELGTSLHVYTQMSKYTCSISFDHLGLDAVDCLSIGYFILNKCLVSTNVHLVMVDLGYCYIGDTETEILIKYIRQVPVNERVVIDIGGKKYIKPNAPGVVIDLGFNTLSHGAIKSLTDALIQTSTLQGIQLYGSLHSTVIDIKSALKYLIEGVSRNSSCEGLAIGHCSLGPAHAYHLALLTAVCSTCRLDLSFNNIRSAVSFIAEAIKHNRAIKLLYLIGCYISDQEVMVLGDALQQNETLKFLCIPENSFSSDALTFFLKGLIGTKSRLCTLTVDHIITDEQRYIAAVINDIRFYQSAPTLQVITAENSYIDRTANNIRSSLKFSLPNVRTRSAFRDSKAN